MKRNPNAICDTCPYWQETPSGNNMGECRGSTPYRDLVLGDNGYQFKLTPSGAWCSRHPNIEVTNDN